MAKTCVGCAAPIAEGKNFCRMCGTWTWDEDKPLSIDNTISLADIQASQVEYLKSGPWDDLLGGGIVKGDVYLLGGFPGAGKSTLCLMALAALCGGLYISGEEAKERVKQRADRLGVSHQEYIKIYDVLTAGFDSLPEDESYNCVILDSLQALSPGNTDATVEFLRNVKTWAVTAGHPVIVIDHATKENPLAGLLAFQHWVDCTMSLECEDTKSLFRVLTVLKNRNGEAPVSMRLKMTVTGLVTVTEELRNSVTPTPRGNRRKSAKGGA